MSDKKNTGGAAFPSGLEYAPKGFEPTQGMSLRDYFAGQALMSMLSTPDKIGSGTPDLAARLSYDFADAMLKAREQ